MSFGDESGPLDQYWEALVGSSDKSPKRLRGEFKDEVEESNFALLQDLNEARKLLENDATLPIAEDRTSIAEREKADGIAIGTTVDGYTITGRIGRGGMGAVFTAHQHALGREVALKMVRVGPLATVEELARFRAEAAATAMLQHPGIVSIYDSGQWQGYHYFAMELIKGEPLSSRLRKGPVEIRQAAQIVANTCEAVEHAHRKGVLHRDLKPSNILLDRDDRPHVVDFGLAKLFADDSEMTRTGAMVGTPSYMSPEQAAGESKYVTPSSDVYSLGAILYELLAGRAPFRAATPIETMRQVVDEQPVSPSALNADVSRDLETICLKCLEKNPERRYASASDLAEDLRRYLDGKPISARPVGIIGKSARWCARNPSLAVAVGLLGFSLLAGTIISTTMWGISNRHAKEAQSQLEIANREAEKARAVMQFFTNDVIGQASPNQTEDREIKLIDVLNSAAAQIDDKFRNEPLVEAAVREAVGETYLTLGRVEECESHLRRVVELRTQALGESHPDTIDAMMEIGGFYKIEGRYAESESQYRKVMSISEETFGSNHPISLGARGQLAHALYWQGRYEEAEPIMVQVLRREEELGIDDQAIVTRNNLAILYSITGRYEASKELLLKNLPMQREVLGEKHQDPIMTLNNLGHLHICLRQFDEAKPYVEEVLNHRRRVLGDHQHTCLALLNMGNYYWMQGKVDEAIPLYREAYQMRLRVSGRGHRRTRLLQARLAQALLEAEKADEATPFVERYRDWIEQNDVDDWRRELAAVLHGASLAAQGEEHTEQVLVESTAALEAASSQIDPIIRERIVCFGFKQLIKHFRSVGNEAQTQKWNDRMEAWLASEASDE